VETSEQIYDQIMDVNLKGAYFAVQKALPHLNDGGSIVLTSSVRDSSPHFGFRP
jgi:NAD(P)-dependent dehydrogenase (short-subunit alcohol dehydrogenase family)